MTDFDTLPPLMANFKTHITTSSAIGVAYGAGAYGLFGMPLEQSLLAAGLCGLSGMLPDLDSDSGIPVRETVTFGAAIVPLLMIDRFQSLGLGPDSIALLGGLIYIAIRFGVAEIFKRYTVHRGMWHSLPAAAIAGLCAFLICASDEMSFRLFKSFAVVLGFVSHLVLDEFYALDLKRLRPRVKRSFGTALKMWGPSLWGNISTYGKLVLLLALALGDPLLMDAIRPPDPGVVPSDTDWWTRLVDQGRTMWR